MASSHRGS